MTTIFPKGIGKTDVNIALSSYTDFEKDPPQPATDGRAKPNNSKWMGLSSSFPIPCLSRNEFLECHFSME